MSSPDPDFWQEAAKWMAGVLIVPIGYVWKKVNSSVQKEDFKDFCQRFDQHCRDDRETQAKLFDKIDDLKTTIIERMK
jgi:hypothetical protein